MHFQALRPARLFLAAVLSSVLFLAGCGLGAPASDFPSPGVALRGNLHGGQQPVSGARVYMYAVSTIGYGYYANSLLNGTGYVTTDTNGNFSITGDYTCPANGYVYLLAKAGNPGLYSGANNADLALMAAVGACSNLTASTFITVNEVTTVATAYALSGFMTSDTQASTSTTNTVGMHNAFASYGEMVNPASGQALSAPVATTGVVPQAEINTLGDILAACVNTDGTTGTCGNLLQLTGGSTDTANAALYIAQHPATNVSALYSLVPANAPFQPTLSAAPNDWSIAITIDGGAFNSLSTLALDATGNVWAANNGGNLVEVATDGTFVSPAAGYTYTGVSNPYYLSFDPSGNLWTNVISTTYRDTLAKISSTGTLLNTYTNACMTNYNSDALTSDRSGNIWFARPKALCEVDTGGNLLSPSTGWTGTASSVVSTSRGLAVDGAGNIWHSGMGNTTVSNGTYTYTPVLAKFSSAGAAISPTAGYTATGYYYGFRMAIDASNTAWVPNFQTYNGASASTSGSIFSVNSSGTFTSPTGGYAPATPYTGTAIVYATAVDGTNRIWTADTIQPTSGSSYGRIYAFTNAGAASVGALLLPQVAYGMAFDSSGNAWVASYTSLTKVVGVGSPTITPLSQAALQNKIGQRP